MKKFNLYWIALLLFTLAFSACDDDDDVTPTEEHSHEEITKVKMMVSDNSGTEIETVEWKLEHGDHDHDHDDDDHDDDDHDEDDHDDDDHDDDDHDDDDHDDDDHDDDDHDDDDHEEDDDHDHEESEVDVTVSIDELVLSAETSYQVSFQFFNEEGEMTGEIREDKETHLIVLEAKEFPAGSGFTSEYEAPYDDNGKDFGINQTLNTQAAGTGHFHMKLLHDVDKETKAGSTDADVDVKLSIQ